jgi:type IV secretory pathway VirB2 component (pilin)
MITLRKKIAVFTAYAFSVPVLFAQTDRMPGNMNTLAQDVQATLTGPFFKTLFGILLCASAIAYAYNKDNEKIKGKIIAIMIAAGILFGATFILDAVWGK